MKKRNKIKIAVESITAKVPPEIQPQVTMHAPEKAKEKVPSKSILGVGSKTYLVPRKVYPRWSGSVDEFGGRFAGDIAFGNGTVAQVACFFDAQRHFWMVIPSLGAGAVFRAGQRTNWEEVKAALSLESEGDAKNLSDFINTQLDDGMDEKDHVGSYEFRYCA
jgi:hypothetical protein